MLYLSFIGGGFNTQVQPEYFNITVESDSTLRHFPRSMVQMVLVKINNLLDGLGKSHPLVKYRGINPLVFLLVPLSQAIFKKKTEFLHN